MTKAHEASTTLKYTGPPRDPGMPTPDATDNPKDAIATSENPGETRKPRVSGEQRIDPSNTVFQASDPNIRPWPEPVVEPPKPPKRKAKAAPKAKKR